MAEAPVGSAECGERPGLFGFGADRLLLVSKTPPCFRPYGLPRSLRRFSLLSCTQVPDVRSVPIRADWQGRRVGPAAAGHRRCPGRDRCAARAGSRRASPPPAVTEWPPKAGYAWKSAPPPPTAPEPPQSFGSTPSEPSRGRFRIGSPVGTVPRRQSGVYLNPARMPNGRAVSSFKGLRCERPDRRRRTALDPAPGSRRRRSRLTKPTPL